MNSKDNNILVRKQSFLDSVARFCDKCGSSYNVDDVNIIQNTGISVIIHFSCHNCKSNSVATLITPLGISNKVPIKADVGLKEIEKFAKMNGVSTEDILEVYSKLKDNSKVSI